VRKRNSLDRSAPRRVAVVAGAMAIVLLSSSRCGIGYYRGLHKHDSWMSGLEFRYEYEVTGLRSFPTRALTLIVDLHYDDMPVLKINRVRFELDGRVLADADPYFLWVESPVPRRESRDRDRASNDSLHAVKFAAPEWAEVEELDGHSLRHLFAGYEAPGYASLADFDTLPATETTPRRLRLFEARLDGHRR